MTHSGPLFVLIGLFFALTGVYAIITALSQMNNTQPASSLDTKFFKFNAPVGFTYGIVALGLVFGIIKFHDIGTQKNLIQSLSRVIDSLKNINGQLQLNNPHAPGQLMKETFSYQEPKSIFGGKVLVEAKSGSILEDPSLKFTGIIGTSKNRKGPFNTMEIETDKGKRFYFMSTDSVVWVINTISSANELVVEIYREN